MGWNFSWVTFWNKTVHCILFRLNTHVHCSRSLSNSIIVKMHNLLLIQQVSFVKWLYEYPGIGLICQGSLSLMVFEDD